jgi:hypothetical protein
MKRIPVAVTLIVLLQSSINGSAVFAQSGERKPGDPVNLGHVHKAYGEDDSNSFKYSYTPSSTFSSSNAAANHSKDKNKTRNKQAPAPAQVNTSMTPVYNPEEHAPVTSVPPYTATNSASETTKPAHTPGKLRNALKGIGNVIIGGSALLASPSTNSPGNASGAPMVGPSSSSSNGMTGVSQMLAPPGGYSSTTSTGYSSGSKGSNPATNFFLRP